MIYDELGVMSYINALDPVAAYGGNLLSPTVLDAMEEATRSFVRMDELHRAVGERIAEMTHNEGAAVVSGSAVVSGGKVTVGSVSGWVSRAA